MDIENSSVFGELRTRSDRSSQFNVIYKKVIGVNILHLASFEELLFKKFRADSEAMSPSFFIPKSTRWLQYLIKSLPLVDTHQGAMSRPGSFQVQKIGRYMLKYHKS